MKKEVVFFLVYIMVLALILTGPGCASNPPNNSPLSSATEVPYKSLVENFIKSNATYAFDGIEGSLKILMKIGSISGDESNLFKQWEYTVEYQTRHPGEGDRTGQVLAQAITTHTAIIKVKDGIIVSAICDDIWNMVNDKNPSLSVTGTVINGGDNTLPGGPVDAPRVFIYEVKRDDGTIVKVSYTAYPPSPVGNANRNKITLEFAGGSIKIGDRLEALGRIDKEINTIMVADQGDYIKTYPAHLSVVSEDVSWQIGDTPVAATITRPDDNDIHPAVVFVPGSGPTDRDWNTPLLPGLGKNVAIGKPQRYPGSKRFPGSC
jgi:hypothetical protein